MPTEPRGEVAGPRRRPAAMGAALLSLAVAAPLTGCPTVGAFARFEAEAATVGLEPRERATYEITIVPGDPDARISWLELDLDGHVRAGTTARPPNVTGTLEGGPEALFHRFEVEGSPGAGSGRLQLDIPDCLSSERAVRDAATGPCRIDLELEITSWGEAPVSVAWTISVVGIFEVRQHTSPAPDALIVTTRLVDRAPVPEPEE